MSDYLDGDLAPDRRRRLEDHIGDCPECRRVLSGLRVMLDALQRLPAPGRAPDAAQIAGSVRVRLSEPRRPH